MFKVEGLKVLIDVEDMGRMVEFYQGTFGLEVVYRSDEWSELSLGTASIGLHGGGSAEKEVKTSLSFTVTDLDAATLKIQESGGTVVSAPFDPGGEGIRLAEFYDPEQNYFMASQELRG
jgi:predicted enzyme related to lactoylglutathione lyase